MTNQYPPAIHHGDTWIDDESFAYNSYSGAPSRSNRRGLVRMPNGMLRIVRLGVADTFFSIPAKPAHGRIGWVSLNEQAGEWEFYGGSR